MKVKLSHDENLKISIDVIEKFIATLDSEDERLFILSNFFHELLREVVKFSNSNADLTHISLHVRNIFELYLIAKHICFNNKALENWFGQAHKDMTEINNGITQLAEKHNYNVSGLKGSQRKMDESLEKSVYKSKGSFNIKELAKQFGFEEDYLLVYKLCSKFIHPSSLKVNAYASFNKNNKYKDVLTQIGVSFCQKVEKLILDIKNA